MNRLIFAALVSSSLAGLSACSGPSTLGKLVVTPFRQTFGLRTSLPHRSISFASGKVRLRGWLFPAEGARRGLIIYLHGHSDNRHLTALAAERFTRKGFDVLGYDSRAHGESTGEACTYGFYEKRDLIKAIDHSGADSVILIGSSLGAAVSLQAAAIDPRIRAVVAHAPFTDLRAAIADRSGLLSAETVQTAIRDAEAIGRFDVDEVSPLADAAKVTVPVLLIHGTKDSQTPPSHSQTILEALAGKKDVFWIEGGGHANVVRQETFWNAIEVWVETL